MAKESTVCGALERMVRKSGRPVSAVMKDAGRCSQTLSFIQREQARNGKREVHFSTVHNIAEACGYRVLFVRTADDGSIADSFEIGELA